MHIHGACHCGSIRFEADVDPGTVTLCHCSDCQTMSGSAFRTVVPALPGSLRVLAGSTRAYVKTAASGRRRAMHFCPDCGTHLWGSADGDDPGRISLRVSTFAERASLPPVRQVWRRSAQPWADRIACVPGEETQSF